jgi:imidazolonepropionase-like amidohydrolase
MAHVYTAAGIRRCIELGIRTLEHANLIDECAAALAADEGAYIVPNLICYYNLSKRGLELGCTPEAMAKLGDVASAHTRS